MVLMTLNSEESVEWTGERRAVRMCPVARTTPRNQEGAEGSEMSQPARRTLISQKATELHWCRLRLLAKTALKIMNVPISQEGVELVGRRLMARMASRAQISPSGQRSSTSEEGAEQPGERQAVDRGTSSQ